VRGIAVAIVSLVLTPVLLGALALSLQRGAVERERALAQTQATVVLQAEQLSAESNVAGRLARDFLMFGDEAQLEEMRAARGQVEDLLDALGDAPAEAVDQDRVAEVRRLWRETVELADRSVALRRRSERPAPVGSRVTVELLQQRDALEAAQEALQEDAQRRFEAAEAAMQREARRGTGLLLASFGAAAGLSALLGGLLLGALRRERQARAEAEGERRLLNLVVEQSGDAIVVTDSDGVVRLFNAEAERLHGVRRHEVAAAEGPAALGLLAPDDRPLPLAQTPLYRALRGEQLLDGRWRVRRPDGTARILVGSATPLRGPDGRPVGAVLSARDETERLLLEAERDESLAQLDALFQAAPVGVGFIDRSLRFLRVNEPLARMSGVPVETHRGRTVGEVLGRVGEELEPVLRRVLESGRPVLDRVLTVPGGGGAPRHFLMHSFAVAPPNRPAIGVGAVVVDITAMKRAEATLAQAVEFRERFMGILGHDLRNPLTAIAFSARTLLRDETLGERPRAVAGRIAASAARMGRMIEEMLDLTRIRLGGGLPTKAVAMDLFELGRSIVGELQAAHPDAEIRLELLGDGRGEWDPGRLGQLLSNLVTNALQHGAPATPARVTIDGRRAEEVSVAVHNEGELLRPELRADIFEPFRRGEGAPRTATGLGLGLHIVQQIARAHGGTVEAESAPGRGTTFRAELPRHAPRAPAGADSEPVIH
jgi:PAS domain S-box-containing protein